VFVVCVCVCGGVCVCGVCVYVFVALDIQLAKRMGRAILPSVVKHILPSNILLIWMHEGNTVNLHVQVCLMMNTWMFETCRRHYYKIKTLM